MLLVVSFERTTSAETAPPSEAAAGVVLAGAATAGAAMTPPNIPSEATENRAERRRQVILP